MRTFCRCNSENDEIRVLSSVGPILSSSCFTPRHESPTISGNFLSSPSSSKLLGTRLLAKSAVVADKLCDSAAHRRCSQDEHADDYWNEKLMSRAHLCGGYPEMLTLTSGMLAFSRCRRGTPLEMYPGSRSPAAQCCSFKTD